MSTVKIREARCKFLDNTYVLLEAEDGTRCRDSCTHGDYVWADPSTANVFVIFVELSGLNLAHLVVLANAKTRAGAEVTALGRVARLHRPLRLEHIVRQPDFCVIQATTGPLVRTRNQPEPRESPRCFNARTHSPPSDVGPHKAQHRKVNHSWTVC